MFLEEDGIGVRSVTEVFFFQAEDGIRVYDVTGVQTCALPILTNSSEGLKFTHSQVQISAVVERFTEGTINVPINIINIPEGIKLKYYPKEVSVVYYTSLSNFKTISTSSFIVEVDYNSLNAQDTYLIPKIVQQPDKVKNVRLNEKRIEFILLQ